jgi:hypothetical protein
MRPPYIRLGAAVASAAASLGLAGAATAADFTDLAPVIASRPVVEQVSVPR